MGKTLDIGQNGTRAFNLNKEAIDKEKRTVELAFSSEEEYERWFGIEILGHKDGEIRLDRMRQGAPLLADHDMRSQIGVVEDVRIDGDLKGRAKVRFSKSARGEEIFQDVIDGIRTKVSVGYRIHNYNLIQEREGVEVYRVTDWEPYEISIVSVPADDSVGVGRNIDNELNNQTKEQVMPKESMQNEVPKVDVKAIEANARKSEIDRIREINALGGQFQKSDIAQKAIDEGLSVDAFRAQILEGLKAAAPVDTTSGFIGMSEKEVKEFSFMRVLQALANPQDRRAQEAASFEFEVSAEAQKLSGVKAQGVLVPFDVLARDMTVVAGTGDQVVSTDLLSQNFINMLRNRSAVLQSATILTGLTGNIAIPKQLSSALIGDYSENGTLVDSTIDFSTLNLSPKRAGGSIPYSKQLLAQSSIDVERLIQNDLLSQIALKIDYNALNGDGSANTPVGIRNTTGVGLIELGANGGAPTWGNFVAMETEISVDNADVNAMTYLLNAKGRGYVKTKEKAAGYPEYIAKGNMINGYGYRTTNQVPSNLTKGTGTNLSNITFGNFADLIIAFWGGVDLIVDPYSRKKEGMIEITADQFYDVGVRRPESFCIIDDAIM